MRSVSMAPGSQTRAASPRAIVAFGLAVSLPFAAAACGGSDTTTTASGTTTATVGTAHGGASQGGAGTGGATTGHGGQAHGGAGGATGAAGHGGTATGTGGASTGTGGATTGTGGAAAHGGSGGAGGAAAGGHGGAGGAACGAGETSCGGVCVALAIDPQNCGACGVTCPADASCSGGACLCAKGELLCGGVCIAMSNDPQNCGACGVECAAGQACSGGSCVCPNGDTLCGGACVDVGSDPKNCGKCGTACGAKEVCASGKCALACDPGLTACSGACVDVASDAKNCGGCGTSCPPALHASPACVGGACATICQPGWLDCDKDAAGACEVNGQSDAKNCGSCGTACAAAPNASPACALGACAFTCAAGFADCDKIPATGCEASLALDPTNCGACGVVCPPAANAVPACASGACAFTCLAGFADCDGDPSNGCEVDLGADPKNCSSCGKACLLLPNADATCSKGACGFTCQAGYLDCDGQANDGCEVVAATDEQNCGACGNVCSLAHASATCSGGACVIAACAGGFTSCDGNDANGCETSTATDTSSCGGCGFACEGTGVKTKTCAAGACAPTCNAGLGDCNGPAPGNVDDGCETSLLTDANNCGACGKACAVGQKCCNAGCQDTTSCALTATGVSPPAGWRNGGDFLTITGTGFAAGVKVLIDDGVAPAWAKDANTLIVQTPPHPDGVVDVKITVGGDTVVLKNGFSYKALGVSSPWQMKPMAKVRGELPGVTVMQDGRVLVVGGTTTPDSASLTLNTGEIYDRSSDTVTAAGNTMSVARWRNSAVTLLTGKVIIAGGCGGCVGGNALSTDLYDPKTNLFSAAAPTNAAREVTRAVLMPDGRVFLASTATSVELYDPIKNTWKLVAHATSHVYGFVVRLRDGRIMWGGGDSGNKTVEIFDPVTETFTATGSMSTGRSMLSAHTLPDGRVIVIGGASSSAGGVTVPQATMETWSPATGQWTLFPVNLTYARCWHASALIRDGSILVMGGYPTNGSCTPTAAVEQVDPIGGTVKPFASLGHANTEWNAVTMLDGSVLAVGGGACGQSSALPDLDFLPGAL